MRALDLFSNHQKPNSFMKKLLLLALGMPFYFAASAQQVPLHLVGEVYFTHNGTAFELSDTSRAVYNAARMPQFLPAMDTWNFDTAYSYTNTGSAIELSGRNLYTYNTAGDVIVSEYADMISGNYVVMNRETRSYDANHNILTEEYEWDNGAGLEKQQKMTFTYNGSNQQTLVVYENWNSSTMQYEVDSRTTFTYDGNGQLTEMLRETYSGSWSPSYRATYTYVGGKNTEVLHEMNNGGTWTNMSLELNTFDMAGNKTHTENRNWMSGSWTNTYANAYTHDGNGNVLTQESLWWNGSSYAPSSKREFTYTTNDYLLKEVAKSWNGSTYAPSAGDDSSFYHYSTGVSVGKSPALAGGIKVYPSPASSYITVGMTLANKQQYSATLYDAAGRVVKSYSNTNAGATIATIDVHDLPAGNYILSVNAGNSVAREKIVIAK
jgi:hypothetical protein